MPHTVYRPRERARVIISPLGNFFFQPAARTVGFSLCSIDAFSPRLSPSLSHSIHSRETYTSHAIVHGDSVRIHVYTRVRERPRHLLAIRNLKGVVLPLRVLVVIFYSLYYSVHLTTTRVNYWPLKFHSSIILCASLIYLKICKYTRKRGVCNREPFLVHM